MKKHNKLTRLLAILAFAFTLASLTFIVGCGSGGKDSQSQSDEPKTEITLELPATLNLSIFKTAKLTATTNSKEAVSYASSDTTILTVDAESGVVTPVKVGKANVTAAVEGKNAVCEVTVTAPNEDQLSVVALNKKVNVTIDGTAKLEVQAFYGEEEIEGATFKFTTSAANVATVDANGNVAGVGLGKAVVTITGEFKGVTLGTDTVEISVIENVEVTASVAVSTLYTSVGFDAENPLVTQTDLNVEVKVNGTSITDPQVSVVSSDEDMVKFIDGKLVAQSKKGNAEITVSYTSALGTTESKTAEITVLYPTKKIVNDEVLSLGINRGMIYVPEIDVVSVQSVELGDEKYSGKIEDGNIIVGLTGVIASEDELDLVMVVDSADTTYELSFTVVVYDYLIGDKAEFTAFANSLSAENYVYAKLTNNVDMENGKITTVNNPSDCTGDDIITSFSLDGDGYSVINLSSQGNRGAFAAQVGKNSVGKNSIIKNIAFDRFQARYASAGGLFMTVANVAFENVYISCSANFNWGATVALWSEENVSYKNVVVYCYEVDDTNRTATGFGRPVGALTSEGRCNAEKNYQNTYAINAYATKMIRGTGHIDGEGDDKQWIDEEPLKYTEGLYSTWSDFKEVVKTLPEGFDSEMWKINGDGELVFVTVPEKQKNVITMTAIDYTELYGLGAVRVEISMDGVADAFLPEKGKNYYATGGIGWNYVNGATWDMNYSDHEIANTTLMQYIVITVNGVSKTAWDYRCENETTAKYKGFANEGAANKLFAPVVVSANDGKIRIDLYTKVYINEGTADNPVYSETVTDGPFAWGNFSVTLLAKRADGQLLNWHSPSGVINLEKDVTYGFNANNEFVKQ